MLHAAVLYMVERSGERDGTRDDDDDEDEDGMLQRDLGFMGMCAGDGKGDTT